MDRAAALSTARALPRIPRAGIWAVAIVALLAATALWVRDSPLVAVKRVTVVGLSGPDAGHITARLDAAARDMTTLHVRTDQLRSVVAPYPIVKGLRVSTDLPHGLRITVLENTPVAAVAADGVRTPVSGDGRLLRGASAQDLPTIALAVAPGGDAVVDRNALHAIAALAAAPARLRSRVIRASTTRAEGLVLTLHDGPALRFGGADRLAAKWAAATAVLASSDADGATYLDLRYPERPAAGGLEDPAQQLNLAAADAATPSAAGPAGSSAAPTGTAPPATTP